MGGPPPHVWTAWHHECRAGVGEFPPTVGVFSPFVRGPLSAKLATLPQYVQDCLVAAPWASVPPVVLPPEKLAWLAEIQQYQQHLAAKGFGKQYLNEELAEKAILIHQYLTWSSASAIIAPALRAHGVVDTLIKTWPGMPPRTPEEMDKLLMSLIIHKSDGDMISALLANVVLLDGSFQIKAWRSSIPKSCPGSGVMVLLKTEYEWGTEPVDPAHGGTSRAETHQELCDQIVAAYGHTTRPVPTGNFSVACALQTAQPGGATMCEYGLVASLVHSGLESVDSVKLEHIMVLIDHTGIGGKTCEVPKISAAMKMFNSVQMFYLLFTGAVLRGPEQCSEVWARVIAEIHTAAGPRQKIHSHCYARKYIRWFELCGARVGYNIPVLAELARPFVAEISRLITDPLESVALSTLMASRATWADTVAIYLQPGAHWPYGRPNATAVAVLEHIRPGSVSNAIWTCAIRRYTDEVIYECMVGSSSSIWGTLQCTVGMAGLSLDASLWNSPHEDAGNVGQPLLSIANETCRLGKRPHNAMILSIIVDTADLTGCNYHLFVAPGSRMAVLSPNAAVPGMQLTPVSLSLSHVGTDVNPNLAIFTTRALWPSDVSALGLSSFMSAVCVETRGMSRCIRTIDVSSDYASTAQSLVNRRQLGCVVADIPLGAQRFAFDRGRHEKISVPAQDGSALARRSCQRYFLYEASVDFVVASDADVTRFMVVLIPMVKDGRAMVLPFWLAFAKASWEYYNRFVHDPLDVAELAAEMGGRTGAEGKAWLTRKLKDMFLELSVHTPTRKSSRRELTAGIDDTLLGVECPFAMKVAAARGGDPKRSLVTELRASDTLPKIIYQFAVLSGARGDLRAMVDRGLALMPCIMSQLFGLTAYAHTEVCGHSDNTELWNSYWIKTVCIKKQTQLHLEATRDALTTRVIQMVQAQNEKVGSLLDDDEFAPGSLGLDTAMALGRVAEILREPPAAPPPEGRGEKRRLTWRRSSTKRPRGGGA